MFEQATYTYPVNVKEEEEEGKKVTSPNSTSSSMSQSDHDTCESETQYWRGSNDIYKPTPYNKTYNSMPMLNSSCLDSFHQQKLFDSLTSNFRYSPLKLPQLSPSSFYEDKSNFLSYIKSTNQHNQNSLEELLKQKVLVELRIDEELAKIRRENYWMTERTNQMINHVSNDFRNLAANSNFAYRNKSEINYAPEYEVNKRPAVEDNLKDTLYGKKVKIENIDARLVLKEIEDITGPKPQQSKWKNFPGHVMFGIKRGCQSYFGDTKGIKLRFIERILSESKETEAKFKEFIEKYKSVWKTYQTIITYINTEGDQEIVTILIKMIVELLSEENLEDFEAWLEETRMNERTKESIRKGKDTIKKDFISRLCQKTSA